MVREVETSLPEGPLHEQSPEWLQFQFSIGDVLEPALLTGGSSLLAQGLW